MIIERASTQRSLADRWHMIPERIRRRINEVRRGRGLGAIVPTSAIVAEPGGPGVFWDPASRHPSRPQVGRASPAGTITRVMIPVALGEAPGERTGLGEPERISRAAFGSAASINARGGVSVLFGHDGGSLTTRAQAVSTWLGLFVEWIPNMASDRHRRVVAEIEAGRWGASPKFLYDRRHVATMLHPKPGRLVTRADLDHVALVADPAYVANRPLVIRGPAGQAGRDAAVKQAVAAAERRLSRGR